MPIRSRVIIVLTALAGFLVWEAVQRYPVYVSAVAAVGMVALLLQIRRRNRRERERGWRLRREGRDEMFYDEWRDDAWQRMTINGEMLCGTTAHHVIYFNDLKFPDWAGGHREEIVARIKSEFCPPGYEYWDA
jgi:hypothetical protein